MREDVPKLKVVCVGFCVVMKRFVLHVAVCASLLHCFTHFIVSYFFVSYCIILYLLYYI